MWLLSLDECGRELRASYRKQVFVMPPWLASGSFASILTVFVAYIVRRTGYVLDVDMAGCGLAFIMFIVGSVYAVRALRLGFKLIRHIRAVEGRETMSGEHKHARLGQTDQ